MIESSWNFFKNPINYSHNLTIIINGLHMQSYNDKSSHNKCKCCQFLSFQIIIFIHFKFLRNTLEDMTDWDWDSIPGGIGLYIFLIFQNTSNVCTVFSFFVWQTWLARPEQKLCVNDIFNTKYCTIKVKISNQFSLLSFPSHFFWKTKLGCL